MNTHSLAGSTSGSWVLHTLLTVCFSSSFRQGLVTPLDPELLKEHVLAPWRLSRGAQQALQAQKDTTAGWAQPVDTPAAHKSVLRCDSGVSAAYSNPVSIKDVDAWHLKHVHLHANGCPLGCRLAAQHLLAAQHYVAASLFQALCAAWAEALEYVHSNACLRDAHLSYPVAAQHVPADQLLHSSSTVSVQLSHEGHAEPVQQGALQAVGGHSCTAVVQRPAQRAQAVAGLLGCPILKGARCLQADGQAHVKGSLFDDPALVFAGKALWRQPPAA